jgi:AraC-like DNA-binding protein
MTVSSSQLPSRLPATQPLRWCFRTFEDCHEHQEVSKREANTEFTQLSAGRYYGTSRRFDLGDVRLQYTETSGTTLNRMRTRDSFVYYSIPIEAKSLVWDGSDLSRPQVIQHARSHEVLRCARDLSCVSIAVPKDRFLRDAVALAGVADEGIRLETGALDPADPATRELASLAMEVAKQSRRADPTLSEAGYLDGLRQRLERSVLEILVGQASSRNGPTLPPESRKKTVLRALEYLEGARDDAADVTIADLCRAAGVSERTLRYAFQEVCGVSPQRFMHFRRLRLARKALLECDGSRGAVKIAAYEAGFRELGRFSVQYREFFGESPSETAAHQKAASLVAGERPAPPKGTSFADEARPNADRLGDQRRSA